MNPNNANEISREQQGIEEEEEDIDYDALYGGMDIDETPPPKTQEMEASYAKIFGDVAKQFTKNALIGAGGTYGDLAELIGGQQSPGAEQRSGQEFETQETNRQLGKAPSFADLYSQSESDELGPGPGTLPTTQGLEKVSEALGGPGEPETHAGKYAARAGKLYGSGVAFGQVNPVGAVAAGVAGQAAEDAGADPLLQTAVEIASLVFSPGQAHRKLAGSAKKEVQAKVEKLRQLGYTEEDITLAINNASKGKAGPVKASKGAKTEQAFEDFADHSDQMVSDILTSEIPGIEHGTQRVHQMASDAYGQVAQEARNLVIKDSTPFINSATNVVRELRRNLGRNPEAESFLGRLHDAVISSTQNPTAENFMNFYKELNSMGKWMGRSQKDRLISQVKDGIKDTFRNEGPQGRELARKFEEANTGIRKAYQAEEVHDLLMKAATQDGNDYKKMHKLFDNADNVHLFEEVLGPRQASNLQLIAKTGKEVKDFDKAWKAASGLSPSKAVGLYKFWSGEFAGLAGAAGAIGTATGAKRLAEEFLTNPKFQNLYVKGLHSLKNESPRAFRSANENMKKYLIEQGIEIDLEGLDID